MALSTTLLGRGRMAVHQLDVSPTCTTLDGSLVDSLRSASGPGVGMLCPFVFPTALERCVGHGRSNTILEAPHQSV